MISLDLMKKKNGTCKTVKLIAQVASALSWTCPDLTFETTCQRLHLLAECLSDTSDTRSV